MWAGLGHLLGTIHQDMLILPSEIAPPWPSSRDSMIAQLHTTSSARDSPSASPAHEMAYDPQDEENDDGDDSDHADAEDLI